VSALRTEHTCNQGTYRDGGCGDPADDLRDREWMCPTHIARFDFDVYATSVLDDQPVDWDIEPDGIVEPPADILDEWTRVQDEVRFAAWCDLNDIAVADRGEWAQEAYADFLVGEAEAHED
jgi:hypothetical protein